MSGKIEPEKVLAFKPEPSTSECLDRDAILYALGIGYSHDPLNNEELQYTYELHDEFKVFPTYCTCLHKNDLFKTLTTCPGLPQFNMMMLLHGEQRIEIIKPLQTNTKYITRGQISDVADKGKGALLTFELQSFEVDAQGKETLAFINVMSTFIRGIGGFGYKGKQGPPIPAPPNRKPCKVIEEKTSPNQAIIYRLSGDYNPLHIDQVAPIQIIQQNMAAMGNFEKPILHGLCSYGISAKAIVQAYCKGDGNRLKAMQSRFTSHVFPGETLVISTWKEGSRVFFTAKTKERGIDVIVGFVDILESAKL